MLPRRHKGTKEVSVRKNGESKEMIMAENISRRLFVGAAVVGAAGFGFGGGFAKGAKKGAKVKFYKNLGPGHIGVQANQRQALDYAVEYGFDGITPNFGEFANKSDGEIAAWVGTMKEKGIRYGAGGLPIQYRKG